METKKPLAFIKLPTYGEAHDSILDANAKSRGVLLTLMLYCAKHPAGGIIHGMKGWSSAKYNREGLTPKDVKEDCQGLWHWKGEDLIVDAYPTEGEQKALETREKMADLGRRSGQARAKEEDGYEGEAPRMIRENIAVIMKPFLYEKMTMDQIDSVACDFLQEWESGKWNGKVTDWRVAAREYAKMKRELHDMPF